VADEYLTLLYSKKDFRDAKAFRAYAQPYGLGKL